MSMDYAPLRIKGVGDIAQCYEKVSSFFGDCSVALIRIKTSAKLARAYSQAEANHISVYAFQYLIQKFGCQNVFRVDNFSALIVFQSTINKSDFTDFQNEIEDSQLTRAYPLIEFFGMAITGVASADLVDAAILVSQESARSQAAVFGFSTSQKINERAAERSKISAIIHTTPPQHYSDLVVQPQYSARDGEITGYEVLSRWSEKRTGLPIGTDEMIDEIVRHDYIEDYDLSVVRRILALEPLRRPTGEKIQISINLSAVTLCSRRAMSKLLKIIEMDSVRADANLITFEITETEKIQNKAYVLENLLKLRKFGSKIAIDDFGVGNSNVVQILEYEPEEIKLDRIFIEGAKTEKGKALFESVLALAYIQADRVVVEGIETEAELEIVKKTNLPVCVQGYFCCRPIPFSERHRFLKEAT